MPTLDDFPKHNGWENQRCKKCDTQLDCYSSWNCTDVKDYTWVCANCNIRYSFEELDNA